MKKGLSFMCALAAVLLTLALTACGGSDGSSGSGNRTPVADAGEDQTVSTGVLVTLDGSGSSDEDGDTLTYSWSFTSMPAGSGLTDADLSDSTAINPTFIPDIDGLYVLCLRVNDGTADSEAAAVTITAASEGNGGTTALTITGFSPTSGPVGTTVTITGTNLCSPAADNSVTFNNVMAAVSICTDTSITTSVPAGATTGAITVTSGGQTATSSTIFTVTADGGGIEESESNDDHGSAQNITANVAINGTTSGNHTGTHDDDWYKISPTITGNYTIQITFGNTGDLDLYLFDSSALTLLGLSTDAAYGGTETITHMFTNNQTYYIWVSPWDCTATTNYTLTVEKQ